MEGFALKMEEYEKKFGDSFPTMPLMYGKTKEEMIEIIDRCIRENKDVYELGILSLDEDVMY